HRGPRVGRCPYSPLRRGAEVRGSQSGSEMDDAERVHADAWETPWGEARAVLHAGSACGRRDAPPYAMALKKRPSATEPATTTFRLESADALGAAPRAGPYAGASAKGVRAETAATRPLPSRHRGGP